MRATHPTDEIDLSNHAESRIRHRLAALLTVLLVIFLLAFIPPLINVSRFQRRIARNISNAVGRPVHFDRVSLSLLPLPGFTLDNFVVDEDPIFGFEPILRADQVHVTLRISSLWGRRVEFSKISLTEPTSVNLIRAANGKWNIETLLLQASHIQAAPTAQRFAGPAARFPYIEATGARMNLKLDQEKTPFSLTDADFALWLPEPHQWHLRLVAHPIRTDTSPGDTGTVRVEAILGRTDTQARDLAASLAQIPIDLHGTWQDAQLGGLSRLVLGRDVGLRGDFSVTASILGTIDRNVIATSITLNSARRADFVPPRTLSLDAACHALAGNTFHSFSTIECHWPPADSSDPSTLIVAAEVPDIHHPESSSVHLTFPAVPAATFFDWLSAATPHPPTGLTGPGTLAGSLNWGLSDLQPSNSANFRHPPQPTWLGELEFSGGFLELDSVTHRSVPLGDVLLHSAPPYASPNSHSHSTRRSRAATQSAAATDSFDLLPISLPLGGKQPAILEGHLDATGYSLHLTGTIICANLLEVGNAVPQLGDGLPEFLQQIADSTPDNEPNAGVSGSGPTHILSSVPIHVDLTATRAWGGPQIWRQTAPSSVHLRRLSSK
jgi:AsmA family